MVTSSLLTFSAMLSLSLCLSLCLPLFLSLSLMKSAAMLSCPKERTYGKEISEASRQQLIRI